MPTEYLALAAVEQRLDFNALAFRVRRDRLAAPVPRDESRALPAGIGIFIQVKCHHYRGRPSPPAYYFFFNFQVLADVSPPSTKTSNTIVSVVADTFILRRISVKPAPPVAADLTSL